MDIKIKQLALGWSRVVITVPAEYADIEGLKLNNWEPKLKGNNVVISHRTLKVDAFVAMIQQNYISPAYLQVIKRGDTLFNEIFGEEA